MSSLRKLISATAVLLAVASQSPGITVRIPTDSLRYGTKNTSVTVPILIDSVGPSDSLASIQLKLNCDTTRIRAVQIAWIGTLSDQPQVSQRDGFYVQGGFKIDVVAGDGSSIIVGSGILINVEFQILNDSAAVLPIQFDTLWTEFAGYRGLQTVRLSGQTIDGKIVMSPVADVAVGSDSIGFTKDTLATVPVVLSGVRGDGVDSFTVRLRSSNDRVEFADVDTAGTLLGKFGTGGGSWNVKIEDAGSMVTVNGRRDTGSAVLPEQMPIMNLKLLVHGTQSATANLMIDSLVVNGIVERFVTTQHDGQLKATHIDTPSVAVREPRPVELQSVSVFPNPVRQLDWLRVTAGSEIQKGEVFDVLGNRVFLSEHLGGSEIEVPTRQLRPGSYAMRIYSRTGIGMARFTIVH